MIDSATEAPIIKGQPGIVILPAKMYTMKTIVKSHVFSIPMVGKFSELYPDFYELTGKSTETDDFKVVFDFDGKLCIASVAAVEVLFAAEKYPALEDNQVFSISDFVMDEKNNVLHITGAVLELVD